MIVGMFSRPAAISWPGRGLVARGQADHAVEQRALDRDLDVGGDEVAQGRMYCPAAPAQVIASDGAAVRTSNATPPAPSMASFSGPTISSRWLKQEASCDEELTIAIFGFSRSASVSPSADHCARRIAHGVVPGGLPGVETRLSLAYQGVRQGWLTPESWVAAVAGTPARIFGLAHCKGALAPGLDADVVVFDPAARKRLDASSLHMATDHSPYQGTEVIGWPAMTIARGRIVAKDGDRPRSSPAGADSSTADPFGPGFAESVRPRAARARSERRRPILDRSASARGRRRAPGTKGT